MWSHQLACHGLTCHALAQVLDFLADHFYEFRTLSFAACLLGNTIILVSYKAAEPNQGPCHPPACHAPPTLHIQHYIIRTLCV